MNILDLIFLHPKIFTIIYICLWNFCSFMYENFTSFIEWASAKFLFQVLLELWIVNFFLDWCVLNSFMYVFVCVHMQLWVKWPIIIEKVIYVCVNLYYVYFTVGENASIWWPLRWFASLRRTLVFADKVTRSWRYF